jgi:hypothetical protein
MDYVQVPEERAEPAEEAKEEIVEESKEVIKEKKKAELVKQMSLSTDGGGKKDFNYILACFCKKLSYLFHFFMSVCP